LATRVKIIGVGGGGVNTVERLMSGGALSMEAVQNATFAAVNTDVQSLNGSPVEEKIVLGAPSRAVSAPRRKSRSVAVRPKPIGRVWIRSSRTPTCRAHRRARRRHGSGAAPVIAEAASKAGAMVIAFVTLPFSWEGERRMKQAREALDALREACEAVIPLQNDALLQGDSADASADDAFDRANAWICAGLNALCSMLFKKGLINIDFATLRSALPVRGGRIALRRRQRLR